MTFIRKWLCTAALALGVVVAGTSAQATTFQVSFFQDGLGGPGANWFGTFEAP
jgi:hypothetical protein